MAEQPQPALEVITTLDEYLKWRQHLTEDQILNVLRGMGRAKERAIEQKCEQRITIVFNAKGYPRYLQVSDDMELKQ